MRGVLRCAAVAVASVCVVGLLSPALAAERKPGIEQAQPPGSHRFPRQAIPASAYANVLASPSEALRLDCERARKGDADAAFRIGNRLRVGFGIAPDRRAAAAWMRAAAARGHARAREQLDQWGEPQTGAAAASCPVVERALPPRREAPAEIAALVTRMAPAFGLDERLVLAVMQVESNFRPGVVSPKNAAGLMQLIPETAQRFGVANVFSPEENIRGGMKYLSWLLSYYRGDVTLAVAAYNAGEGAVDRHGGVPPYAETRAYVQMIRHIYPVSRHSFDGRIAAPSPMVQTQVAAAAR